MTYDTKQKNNQQSSLRWKNSQVLLEERTLMTLNLLASVALDGERTKPATINTKV